MVNFKKDDKIVYLGGANDEYITVGAIGVVLYANEDEICAVWDLDASGKRNESWMANPNEVRLVGEKSPALQVKIKKLDEAAVIPKYAKNGDAGLDLVATSYEFVNERHVYGTGLAVEIPAGYVGFIFPRSSICKYDLRLTNSVGVIDSGYRGEIKFQFESNGYGLCVGQSNVVEIDLDNKMKFYKVGDKIGQLVIMPYPEIELVQVEDLSETERGQGGFGSSGA